MVISKMVKGFQVFHDNYMSVPLQLMVKVYGNRLYVCNKRLRNASSWSWKLIFNNRVPPQITTEIV